MRAHLVIVALALVGSITACSSSTSGAGGGSGGSTGGAGGGSGGPGSQSTTASLPGPTSAATASRSPTSTAPSSRSAPPAPTTKPVPARPLLTKAIVAPDGNTTYVVKVWAETRATDCAAHAYGASVIDFLNKHPCTGLMRRLVTTTVNGRAVGFAQNSIGFTGASEQAVYEAAGKFRALVTKDGTGNLNDLLREGYRLPSGPTSVPYPDAFLALSQDNSVSVVDAWYLQGSTPNNDHALIQMANDIYLQF